MWRAALSIAVIVAASNDAGAQTSSAARKAARELVEFLRSRFAREVAEEGVERPEKRFALAIDDLADPALKRQFAHGLRNVTVTVFAPGPLTRTRLISCAPCMAGALRQA